MNHHHYPHLLIMTRGSKPVRSDFLWKSSRPTRRLAYANRYASALGMVTFPAPTAPVPGPATTAMAVVVMRAE